MWRNGKSRDLTVAVARVQGRGRPTRPREAKPGKPEAAKPGKLGLAVTDLTAEQKKALKLAGGVAVEAVDGAALAAGIGPGDVILRVNNTDIANVKAFNDAVAKLDPKKPAALLVRDETARASSRPAGKRVTAPTAEAHGPVARVLPPVRGADRGPEAVPGPLRLRDRGGGRRPLPRLEEKWGDKVPVLLDGELEICHYYLDLDAVDARLARMK